MMSDRERIAPLVRSTAQHLVLIELAKRHGWRQGAEIGVLKGRTLFAILDACPLLSMVAVDQWRTLPYRPDDCAETYDAFDMRAIAEAVAARALPYGPRCRILRGDSVEMAAAVGNGTLDFVFIDADHTEAGFARDLAAWRAKVRKGGMLLGHDNHWPTVRRVLDAHAPGWVDHGEAVWGVAA